MRRGGDWDCLSAILEDLVMFLVRARWQLYTGVLGGKRQQEGRGVVHSETASFTSLSFIGKNVDIWLHGLPRRLNHSVLSKLF